MRTDHAIACALFCVFAFSVLIAPSCEAQQVSVTWQRQQLQNALSALARIQGKALWLDRRVDPAQLVSEKYKEVPVGEATTKLLQRFGLESLQIEGLLYVGPREPTRGLAALLLRMRASVESTSPRARQRWLKQAPTSWPRLTRPRKLLERLCSDAGIQIEGLERVPHDLWPAREGPSMSLADRVVLILAGFDLTCEISTDGQGCKIVPIRYPLPDESAKFSSAPNKRKRRPQAGATRQQFSLRLQNQPVGRVLDQLAAQLNLKLVWDEPSLQQHKRSRETLISCQVQNVDLDQLLEAILGPAGMTFSKKSKQVTIRGVP